jgi:hypothetical protein
MFRRIGRTAETTSPADQPVSDEGFSRRAVLGLSAAAAGAAAVGTLTAGTAEAATPRSAAVGATTTTPTRRYYPSDYGAVGSTPEASRAAIQAAIDAAYAAGGGIVDCSGPQIVIGPNAALLSPATGLPYTSLMLKDRVRIEGNGMDSGGLLLAPGSNCHVIGHPGRLNKAGYQDHIDNAGVVGLRIDGNAAAQDGAHDHDGLHLPQYPGLVVEDVMLANIDGHSYYSTANGDFGAGIGTKANVTEVKPIWLERVWATGGARWGFFMSATNRKTHEHNLYASGTGTPQARIAGKKVVATISAAGKLVLSIDGAAATTVTFAAGDDRPTILRKLNDPTTGLRSHATAAFTAQNRLLITSATTGGKSAVYVQPTSTASILADLGYVTLVNVINGENNAQVGGNEYGGFFADHSEANGSGWFADSCFGDGIYVHNVNLCQYGPFESTNNSGLGIYVEALNTSMGNSWVSAMNCVDLGFASHRSATFASSATTSVAFPKAETVFSAAMPGGYGITRWSAINGLIGPGIKSSLGPNPDNRHASYAIAIEHGVDSSLVINNPIYGDGGLVRNLLDYR